MGGGVSLPAVPLGIKETEQLQEQYTKLSSVEGKSDEEISAALESALPAIHIFNQIDCDHNGHVTKANVHRLLRNMPRHMMSKKDVQSEAGPVVSLEEMISAFDDDGDGELALVEFVRHLDETPSLKHIIMKNFDPATGKIKGYQSLEAQLEELQSKAQPLEMRVKKESGNLACLSAADAQKIERLRQQIAQIEGLVGTAGLAFFRQIDLDASGSVDRAELLAALKAIPMAQAAKRAAQEGGGQGDAEAAAGAGVSGVERVTDANVDEVLQILDVDGDGTVSEDEWVAQLARLPNLKQALEDVIDPATGKLLSYANVDSAAPGAGGKTGILSPGGLAMPSPMTEGDDDDEAEDDF